MSKNQKAFFDIAILAALFAPSFIFIKIAVQEISPITLIALRLGIAGILLFVILKLKGIEIPKNLKLLKTCFILGIFANGPPFICFSIALKYIPSSLSALINGTTPLLTIILANIFLEDEGITFKRIVAFLLGFTGFLILFLPALLTDSFSFDTLGIVLCFIGSCSYAIAAVYARKSIPKAPPLVAPTLQLLTSFLLLIPFAFIFESPVEVFEASLNAWFSVLGVAIFGTMFAFILYHRIVTEHGATVLSMSAFLLPIFGTLLGVVFLHESLSMNFILAAILILSGIAVMNGMIRLPFSFGRTLQ